MTTMTRVQAEALAAFITRIRPEWRPAGILAALEKAAPTADVFDVARALVNLAAEPGVLTPGLLPGPGPHWRKPGGERIERRGDLDVPCPDHPEHSHPCPTCKAERETSAALASTGAASVRAALADAPRYATPEQRRTNSRNQEDQ
jgi:hypothetical protein